MGINRGKRGAVLAEFIIAFMPICAMFLCTAQLCRYAVARMVVMRTGQLTARACSVIIAPNPGHDDNLNGKDDDLKEAAHAALRPFGGNLGGNEILIKEPSCSHDGPSNGGTDTVTFDVTYTCTVPLAKLIVCSGGTKTWTQTAKFPHQGADYQL